LMAPTAHS